MNIGDYVRTKSNGIQKIDEEGRIDLGLIRPPFHIIRKEELLKSSPNIIDLIEVGDYVNGWRVNRVEKDEDGTILTCGTITSFVSRNEKDPYLTQDYNEADKMCKLKSIVTHEQFESMEYKL